MSKQIQIAIFAAAALVLAGGGFVAGVTVGPELGGKGEPAAAAGAQPSGAARQQGARAGAAAGAGATLISAQGNQTVGRVISVSDGAITIEVRQPGSDTPRSVIALVGSNARIVKTTETDIKLSDIKPGDQVLVIGQTDQATSTVSATAVIDGFNALQQIFGGGPAGGARPSGAPQRPSPSPSARP